MARDTSLTVWDNAKLLTVAQCHEHLMRIDEGLAKHGPLTRLTESREFFERQLARCLRKRERTHYDQQSECRR
jgi:hypothetical protein